MKVEKIKTLKMAISATIAIFIASYLKLEFSVTAGIIAILSIENTKKESIIVAGRRGLAAIIAIFLSFILYLILGNNAVIFGLFLLIFIPLTMFLNIQEGTVVGAVLSTHLLTSNNISIHWVINENFLIIIGIGVAMIFNLLTRSLDEDFINMKNKIEENFKLILVDMSDSLLNQAVPIYQQKVFLDVETLIGKTKDIAEKITNNYVFKSNYYHINYINMRTVQFDIIKRMKKHFLRFNMTLEQTKMLSNFTFQIANNIFENNDCIEILEQLNSLRKEYEMMELPSTREEFENRALLYQFLNDLEDFLLVKRNYILKLESVEE